MFTRQEKYNEPCCYYNREEDDVTVLDNIKQSIQKHSLLNIGKNNYSYQIVHQEEEDMDSTSITTTGGNKNIATLIWLDEEALNNASSNTQSTIEMFKSIENIHYELFNDSDQFFQYIEEIKNPKKLLVIMSGVFATMILRDLPVSISRKILSTLIYCKNSDDYRYLYKKCRKLNDICVDENILKEAILIDLYPSRDYLLKDEHLTPLFSLKTNCGRFNRYTNFINLIRQFESEQNCTELQKVHIENMLNECMKYRKNDKTYEKQTEEFRNDYTRDKAIQWYTKDTFIYRQVNKALRSTDIYRIIVFLFYIHDLCQELEKLKEKNKIDEVLTVFRGQGNLTNEQLNELQANIGCLISFNGFLSTTTDYAVAKVYAESGSLEDKSIIYEIKVNYNASNIVFANISNYSVFKEECEILFSLCSIFQIDDIIKVDDQLLKIKMTAIDVDPLELSDLTNEDIVIIKQKHNQSSYDKNRSIQKMFASIFSIIMILVVSITLIISISLRDRNLILKNCTGPNCTPFNKNCSSRELHVIADILYSFDCLNFNDDITGMYNGIPALPSSIINDSQISKSLLPVYVTPDYSGQGAALKLNSSIKYQYIKLIRSPIFYNRTFTISVWLYPNIQASKFYAIISQMYSNAPALIFSIVDLRIVMRVYKTVFWSNTRLKNFQWQHVAMTFAQEDLSFAVFINGILDGTNRMNQAEYGNFQIEETNIGSYGTFNQYNGLMDQFAILFQAKSNADILDEATVVVRYNFEGQDPEMVDLFKDNSVNNIRAKGSHVSRIISSRRHGYSTLSLYNPYFSYFQTGGFVLLSTHNYSYAYALWIHVSNVTSSVPLIHLTTRSEISLSENNSSFCVSFLVLDRIDKDFFQLSLYIYGSTNPVIIKSAKFIPYSTWFYVVVMLETNIYNLYVNGTLVTLPIDIDTNILTRNNQQRLTLTIGSPFNTSHTSICHINHINIQLNESIIGIDDLRFYSRALKMKEIQALNNDDHRSTSYYFEY